MDPKKWDECTIKGKLSWDSYTLKHSRKVVRMEYVYEVFNDLSAQYECDYATLDDILNYSEWVDLDD